MDKLTQLKTEYPDIPVEHRDFMQSYMSNGFNKAKTIKDLDITPRKFSNMLKIRYIREWLNLMQARALSGLDVNPINARHRFVQLYNKLAQKFDEGDTKMAQNLVSLVKLDYSANKLLDTKTADEQGVNININIDYGDDFSDEKMIEYANK